MLNGLNPFKKGSTLTFMKTRLDYGTICVKIWIWWFKCLHNFFILLIPFDAITTWTKEKTKRGLLAY